MVWKPTAANGIPRHERTDDQPSVPTLAPSGFTAPQEPAPFVERPQKAYVRPGTPKSAALYAELGLAPEPENEATISSAALDDDEDTETSEVLVDATEDTDPGAEIIAMPPAAEHLARHRPRVHHTDAAPVANAMPTPNPDQPPIPHIVATPRLIDRMRRFVQRLFEKSTSAPIAHHNEWDDERGGVWKKTADGYRLINQR